MGVPLSHPFELDFPLLTIHLGLTPFMETPIYMSTHSIAGRRNDEP